MRSKNKNHALFGFTGLSGSEKITAANALEDGVLKVVIIRTC